MSGPPTQSSPLQHTDAFPVGLNGSGNSSFSGSAFAYPGHVGVQDRLETNWTGISAGSRCDVDSKAIATDFVVSGPPGFAGNASHGARVNVDARAKFGAFVATGDLTSSNHDTRRVTCAEFDASPSRPRLPRRPARAECRRAGIRVTRYRS